MNLNQMQKKEKKIIRVKYEINADEIVLMFFGHEFRKKGLEFVIRALPLVKEDVKSLIAGRDNPTYYKRLALKFGVLDKVIFAGFVSGISEYFAAFDIFVFPTAYEVFSLVTLEAVASGLPILATKVNGTEELIKEDYNGFFIRRDPKDITKKINNLIEDEQLRRMIMSRNARKTAENYSWDKIARILEVYQDSI